MSGKQSLFIVGNFIVSLTTYLIILSFVCLNKNTLLIQGYLSLTITKLELSDFHKYIEEKQGIVETKQI